MSNVVSSFIKGQIDVADPTVYLAGVADWLNNLATTLGHGFLVDQIRGLSRTIQDFKSWLVSFIDLIYNENNRDLADLGNRLNGLHIQNVAVRENIQITNLQETFVQLNILKHNSPSEPVWEPLVFDINHPEICEEREANMKAYLEKNRDISEWEMRSWVMLAMGIVLETENSDYLVMHLKEMAQGRGGQALVKLMEFEIETEASEAIYEEDVEDWYDEQE